MALKFLKSMLGIPAKSKITGTVLYGKTKHDFPLYQHYKAACIDSYWQHAPKYLAWNKRYTALNQQVLSTRAQCVSLKTNSKKIRRGYVI